MNNWIQKSLATAIVGLAPAVSVVAVAQSNTLESDKAFKPTLFNTGYIRGNVYDDKNANGKRELFERGLEGVVVYLDENDNGVRDFDELFTRTNSNGKYFFSPVPVANYKVRQEVPFGWRNITGGEGAAVNAQVIPAAGDMSTKIIGGAEADISEYPFMVAVGYNFSGAFYQFCGGVLISDQYVATAAHCSVGAAPGEVGVLAGTNNIEDGSGLLMTVTDIVVHPEFDELSGVGAGYDMAIWKLEEPIDLEASGLETVEMLTAEDAALAADGELATTVGWGVSSIESTLLQDVHLPVYDTEACHEVYADSINFETQICGGAVEGGIDACQGDSGGPLLVRDFDADKWKLAGITSYGNGCAMPGNPGVWGRVSAMSEWAKSVATGESRSFHIGVRPFRIAKADFGMTDTLLAPSKRILPRWQLVNTLVDSNQWGTTFSFDILDEEFLPREFDCGIDPDSIAALPAEYFSCYSGSNTFTFDSLEDGIYFSDMVASYDGEAFFRSNSFIVGTPEEVSVDGELTFDDEIDPDYPGFLYFIDYYDLNGLSGDKAVQVKVTANTLDDIFVAIYDRDLREAQGYGGVLATDYAIGVGTEVEFTFVPPAGLNLTLGVSTFSEALTGEYTVTVINEGEPVPTTLELESVVDFEVKSWIKDPMTKSLVAYPAAH